MTKAYLEHVALFVRDAVARGLAIDPRAG